MFGADRRICVRWHLDLGHLGARVAAPLIEPTCWRPGWPAGGRCPGCSWPKRRGGTAPCRTTVSIAASAAWSSPARVSQRAHASPAITRVLTRVRKFDACTSAPPPRWLGWRPYRASNSRARTRRSAVIDTRREENTRIISPEIPAISKPCPSSRATHCTPNPAVQGLLDMLGHDRGHRALWRSAGTASSALRACQPSGPPVRQAERAVESKVGARRRTGSSRTRLHRGSAASGATRSRRYSRRIARSGRRRWWRRRHW